MTAMPLEGMLVVDVSSGIGGGYCTKTLADGGAEVLKLETPDGDPLRRWAIGGLPGPDHDGPLFEFLACSKRSLVIDPAHSEKMETAKELVRAADVVVWTSGTALAEALPPETLRTLAPGALVAAISPFGLKGPWVGRASNDLTLQAWAGALFCRGTPDRPPVQMGGRTGEWLGGLFASVGILAAWQRRVRSGEGELLDVSMLEALVIMGQMYGATKQSTVPPGKGRGPERVPPRSVMIPSVDRAKDDWVGFMVATATMWESFCVMVEHPEWIEDERLYAYAGRELRREELESAIREWVERHSAAEVVETADLLRVPAAPIGNGELVTTFDHFVERGFYLPNPKNGYLQPDVPYTLGASAERRPPEPSPSLGELDVDVARKLVAARGAPMLATSAQRATAALPFEGMRVADFTAFWAGPIVGHFLAMMGAEVIHVESAKQPDGIRGHTVASTADDLWWEWTPLFHGPNTNKFDVTLDMSTEEGRGLARRLIAECDVMLENYAPRVIDQWGLGWEVVSELRPDMIFLRMPAFGLSGPWRNRTGYAQNMEQVSGMAWLTGFADGPPMVPNGICDPLAGTHATLALLLAIEHRRRTGEGMLVEVPMVGAAMNIAAEQTLEYQAFGHLMMRDGNRGPTAAPQGIYRCVDVLDGDLSDAWVALAVENDEQWAALCGVIGGTPGRETWSTATGRRAAHDEIDSWLAEWCRSRTDDEIVAALWPAGVPVAKVLAPPEIQHLEQLSARGFFETVVHPVVGTQLHYGYPVRFGAGPEKLHRAPAPTLGQHNRQILGDLLGLDEDEQRRLEAAQVIGTRLLGEHRTR